MRVAQVHYHFRQGGVTSVIRNQAAALTEAGAEVLIIAGETSSEWGYPFALVPALAYGPQSNGHNNTAEGGAEPADAAALAGALLRAMEAHWGTAADVVHVHNPLIQKNAALLPALRIMQKKGIGLLLQIHDLAEDFRPDVYVHCGEYPENCHYAVINRRDYICLHRAGLNAKGLHLIPNEVRCLEAVPNRPQGASLEVSQTRYLYPVRAIRRKNIGEALLLSLFIPKGRTVAFTLPPSGMEDIPYRHWIALAGELDLPMEWSLGLKHSLPELYSSAVCVISTSIKEGFGFSFLEPWTAGRGLLGRRIDYVCRDFEDAGLHFDSLYKGINIPLEYVSPSELKNKMERAMIRVYRAFGQELPSYMLRMITEDLFSRDTLDFGRLDEITQTIIIRTLAANKGACRDISAHNPFLVSLGDEKFPGNENELIESNGNIVRSIYGRERISDILLDVYRQVIEHPVIHKLSKQMLLDLYLDPFRFSLVGFGDDIQPKG
jgi:glycosyltransferase involved in cell wall biosynthesis